MSEHSQSLMLYSGSDLENAYELSLSRLSNTAVSSDHPPRWTAAAWAARSALRHAHRQFRSLTTTTCREVRGLGRPPGIEEPVCVRYLGEMNNFQFLINACFEEFDISGERELTPFEAFYAAHRHNGDEDLLLVDAESPLLATRVATLRLPPWLKQRVPLQTGWTDFITELPRNTRKEVARYLRKYNYGARLSNSDSAFERFYHDLYRPHVSRKYGEEAFILGEASFRRDRADTELIELLHDDNVVAANVIRIVGDTMWILWCGFSELVESRNLKGTTDVLDYFSIVYAACRGVNRIDFGRSRPRLNDGLLMYKAKWNTEVCLGPLKRSPLRILPRNLRPPTARALARSHWVVRSREGLNGVILFDQGPVAEASIKAASNKYHHPGIDRLRICSIDGFQRTVDKAAWSIQGVDLVDLSKAHDPVRRYLGA